MVAQALVCRTKKAQKIELFGNHSYFVRQGASVANKKQLRGESAPHSYFVRQMGRPGEQNTTVLRRYRKLFVFHSPFSRHGALNAHKKRTKNECVPKVDKLRIPFVKWLPGHLYGEQKKMLRFLFANGVPGQQKCEHMAIKGRSKGAFVNWSPFCRILFVLVSLRRFDSDFGAKVGRR